MEEEEERMNSHDESDQEHEVPAKGKGKGKGKGKAIAAPEEEEDDFGGFDGADSYGADDAGADVHRAQSVHSSSGPTHLGTDDQVPEAGPSSLSTDFVCNASI